MADAQNIIPIAFVDKSRGVSSRSYQYSPHLLYSPHILYPGGVLTGIFPDSDAIASPATGEIDSNLILGDGVNTWLVGDNVSGG